MNALEKRGLSRQQNTKEKQQQDWDCYTRRHWPSWTYEPHPKCFPRLKAASQWPQYLRGQKGGGAPGAVHKWEMTDISHTSTVGLGMCVGGSQVNPMTSTSSPVPAGSVPRSWELGLASSSLPGTPHCQSRGSASHFHVAWMPRVGCNVAPGSGLLGQLLEVLHSQCAVRRL